MRQIFQSLPWIHPVEPEEITDIYRKHGVRRHVKRGEILKHGGQSPKLFFLEKGLCAYFVGGRVKNRPSVLSLILPGRTMGDITCFTKDKVNVLSLALKDSTVLEVDPFAVLEESKKNPDLMLQLGRLLIHKQESHMEGLLANFTLPAADRLKVLVKALFLSYRLPIRRDDWNVVPLRLNNEQLALIVNLTRISVSKILSEWQEAGLARKDGMTLLVRAELLDGIYDWMDEPAAPPLGY
ncbi:MAG: Crp/Fnr family transcriptional regulator [Duodenibacillus sp.]|nr:Crp/Fnr family transcriptional regulator [Duodenibacillus sp.]